ncbi:MAG: efflux RND transporter permease subunit, partial [Acidobacteriota bacterium]
EAGRLRLRPILLTSVTTILGLLPMAIGLGGSSKTWQPLATTIAAGLAVATVICLFVIPCLQAIVDDFGDRLRRFTRRTSTADSAESPAVEDATGGPLPEPATRGPLDLPARGGASPTPT